MSAASPAPAAAPREVLAGLVERVTFHSAESGFCVLRVRARGHRDAVTVVGHAASVAAGEWVKASGAWTNDRTHGLQFRAPFLKTTAPTSAEGIERYLASGLVRSVGPVYARALKAFGERVFEVVEASPERLREVRGVSPRRAERIAAAWAEQIAAKGAGDAAARLAAIDALLLPDADGVIERCEAHAALAGGNHLPLLGRFYKGQRTAIIRFLDRARPLSTSQDRSLEEAIVFLLDRRSHRHPKLAVVREEGRGRRRAAVPLVDLSFVPDRWWPLVTGRARRDPAPREVDRRTFELCLFTQTVNELKSGDLCLPGSDDYGDCRGQLVSWEEYRRDVDAYTAQAGVPADPAAFVAELKDGLAAVASEIDRAFPDNEHVEIVADGPVIGRLRAKGVPHGAERLERLMKERLAPVGILDALAETEHWLGWTRAFGSISGLEAKLDRPRERYLSAAFCYGCGLGPTQTARSLKGLDRRHVAFVNQRHVREETLDEAIASVIDAYAAIGLHAHWGTGDAASAGGMKRDVHPASLMTEYHVRYGGYGGICYYLVSDTYIALFSRFIAWHAPTRGTGSSTSSPRTARPSSPRACTRTRTANRLRSSGSPTFSASS